jgi:AbrB family looped-hinge helix DNA binding protein
MNFYGVGTVGEKGQIVIPAKARAELKIESGNEFIFFGHGKMINIVKASELNEMLNKLSEKFTEQISNVKEKISKIRNK